MEVATKIALWNAYQVGTKVSGVSKFDTSNFGTEETSAPSSIEMLASAPCKGITCAEVNENFQNLCRSLVPKLTRAEVRLPESLKIQMCIYKLHLT